GLQDGAERVDTGAARTRPGVLDGGERPDARDEDRRCRGEEGEGEERADDAPGRASLSGRGILGRWRRGPGRLGGVGRSISGHGLPLAESDIALTTPPLPQGECRADVTSGRPTRTRRRA